MTFAGRVISLTSEAARSEPRRGTDHAHSQSFMELEIDCQLQFLSFRSTTRMTCSYLSIRLRRRSEGDSPAQQ